jgi:hypothetical protein
LEIQAVATKCLRSKKGEPRRNFFPQRFLRQRRPLFELLEDRRLLAGSNTFAQFVGSIDMAAERAEIAITLSSPDFTLRGTDTQLGFHVRNTTGLLDPAPVEIRNQNGTVLSAIYSAVDVANTVDSLAIVPLGPGTYSVIVADEGTALGSFALDVFLIGDADGNHTVDRLDADLVRTMFGAQQGIANYAVEADANLDGRITSFDLFQWQVNSNDATDIVPLSLSASTTVAGASATTAVDDQLITVIGSTSPVAIVELDINGDGITDRMTTAAADGSFSFDLTFADVGARTLTFRAADSFGQQQSQELAINVGESFQITEVSPANGESMVSTTRDVVLRFSERIDPTANLKDAVKIITLGEPVQGDFRISSTGLFATFLRESNTPWQGSTEIRIQVDGTQIRAANGDLLDADADGQPGGTTTADFRTVPATLIPNTLVKGRVVASEPDALGNDQPLGGVTIRVDGFANLYAVTDVNGNFTLGLDPTTGEPIGLPSPEYFVHIDGTTVTTVGGKPVPPNGGYPNVGKSFPSIPGQTLVKPFDIYLPFIPDYAIHPVTPNQEMTIGLPQQQIDEDPSLAMVKLTVPAGSLIADDGKTPGKEIGIYRVDSDRLPAPLPFGLNHSFDITVQADVDSFDIPAPIEFPNLDGLAPGAKTLLMSFDHPSGEWVVVGTMTAIDRDGDGIAEMVASDSGQGIRAPGWHGFQSGCPATDGGASDSPPECEECDSLLNSALIATVKLGLTAIPKLALIKTAISVGNLIANCVSSVEECAATISVDQFVKLLPWWGQIVPTYTKWALYYACEAVKLQTIKAAAEAVPSDTFLAQFRLIEDLKNAYESLLGTDVLSNVEPEQIEDVSVFIDLLAPTVRPESASGVLIDAGELSNMLLKSQPLNLNFGHEQIIQISRRLNELSMRQLPPSEIAKIEGFGSQLESTALELERRGWVTVLESLTRGIKEKSAEIGLSLSGSALVSAGAYYRLTDLMTGMVLNGRLSGGGSANGIILRPNSMYLIEYLHPLTLHTARTVFASAASGINTSIPRAVFAPSDLADEDNDGLAADVEEVLGLNLQSTDSDADGMNDLAEIQQGLNPLDGIGFPITGLIGSVPVSGEVQAIAVEGSILEDGGQTAYVATGSYGLAIFDASQFNLPIALGQIDLAGNSTDVAVDSNLQVAAVAANSGGLHLVNVSDPMTPQLIRTVSVPTGIVEVFQGNAYIPDSGSLRAIDLLTGETLQTLPLGSAALTGIAREGAYLYTMDGNRNLRAIDIGGFEMVARDSLQLPDGGGKLFVGNGIAYAVSTDAEGGYSTADTSNPDELVLISGSDLPAGLFSPKAGLAVNGSGLGVFVGPVLRENSFSVMEVSDPQNTNDFRTRFDLPGTANDVAIASGIAFVASSASLQVVNYRPFDSSRQPPTLSITLPTADLDPVAPGVQVIEGTTIPVKALVGDDVQVRNVELIVNGQVAANDVSFPFDLSVIAARAVANSPTMTVQLRAIDTGGNATLSNEFVFEVGPDKFAPELVRTTPANGEVRNRGQRRIEIEFSEPLDTATVTSQTFRLRNALGTELVPIAVELRSVDTLVELTYTDLPEGSYELLISADSVTDRAGNPLGTQEVIRTFTLTNVQNIWVGPTSGVQSWNVPSNWSTGQVPGPQDNVSITAAGNYTVNLTANAQIASLTLGGPSGTQTVRSSGGLHLISASAVNNNGVLEFTGGSLNIDQELTGAGSVRVVGTGVTVTGDYRVGGITTISQGDVTFDSTAITGSLHLTGGTLAGSGDIWVTDKLVWTSGTMQGTGRTIASGMLEISGDNEKVLFSGRRLENRGSGTWSGNGALRLHNGAMFTNLVGATFEIQNAVRAFHHEGGGPNPTGFTNAGMLRKTSAGSTRIEGGGLLFTNTGTLEITNGTFELSAWRSTLDGMTTVGSGGTLRLLNWNFTLPDTSTLRVNTGGTWDVVNSSVSLDGTANAPGVTFTNSNVTLAGTLMVSSATLSGSNVTLTGAATITNVNVTSGTLNVNMGSSPTFESVTLTNANLNLSRPLVLSTLIFGGGSLNGGSYDLTVNSSLVWTGGTMQGSGRTISIGTLEISGDNEKALLLGRQLENSGMGTWSGNGSLRLSRGAKFTILVGATFEIQNAARAFHEEGSGGVTTFINAGTLRKTSTGTTRIEGGGLLFTNTGTLEIANGTFELSAWGSTLDGMTTVGSNGTLRLLNWTFTLPATSSLTVSAGGTWDIVNSTVSLDGTVNAPGVTFSNSTVTLNGTATIPALNVSGGSFNVGNSSTPNFQTLMLAGALNLSRPLVLDTLSFTAGVLNGGGQDLIVNNSLLWTSGAMQGSGRTIAIGTLEISGSNEGKLLNTGRILENRGTGTWKDASPLRLFDGAQFVNAAGATFEIQNGVPVIHSLSAAAFINAGTLRKTSPGVTRFDSSFILFSNTGTLIVNAGGVLEVVTFSQSDSGNTELHIAGPTPAEQARLSTTSATLNGTLRVFRDGGFTPAPGTVVSPVTYVTRTGTFATIDGIGVTYTADYGASSLNLTVVAAPAALTIQSRGDFNDDGIVNAADYIVWRKTLNTTVPPTTGADGNGDGIVDQADYHVWRANFGRTAPGSERGSSSSIADLSGNAGTTVGTSASSLLNADTASSAKAVAGVQAIRAETRSNRPLPSMAFADDAFRDDALIGWLTSPATKSRLESQAAAYSDLLIEHGSDDDEHEWDDVLDIAFATL